MNAPGILRRTTMLAVLAAAASAIQILESPLPRLLPWLKPGLSNAIVLFSMERFSVGFGVALVFAKTILTGIALGILFSPAHLLSLAGGLSAVIVMFALLRQPFVFFGLAGISVAGAFANNLAQFGTVQSLFGANLPMWFPMALMIWIAIPSGLIVARLTHELLRRTS